MRKLIRTITLSTAIALTGMATSAGCGSGSGDHVESAPVSIAIRFVEDGGSGDAARAAKADGGLSTLALIPGLNNAVEYDDVTRILVDITLTENTQPYYINFDLTRESANSWIGEVPLLPRNRQLRFAARALDASGATAFSGETIATLAVDNTDVSIPLAPAQDGAELPMPQLTRILYPAEILSGQEEQFAFSIRGNAGTSIQYRISAVGSTAPSPAFAPATGSLTLGSAVTDFMTVYTAPEVSADTSLAYQVTITAINSLSAVAITTNFTALIKPRPVGGPIVGGTRPSVVFNPVILSLTANGTAIDNAVELVAAVSDDSPQDRLAYEWTFTPNAGTQDGTFAGGGLANPALFENYTPSHQGIITLAVTDERDGTTTLNYTLLPNQFASQIGEGPVNGIKRIVSGMAHTCVLTGARRVRCWGDNHYGQLGYANTNDVGATPGLLPRDAGDVPLPALDPVVQLVAGNSHTCALLQSGLISCWGRNHAGQLGYGHTNNIGDGEPITSSGYVTLGGFAAKIAAGGDHTCAILRSGSVRCWGNNDAGQLGRGNTDNIGDNERVEAAGDLDFGGVSVRDLALGSRHSCAILTTGALRCWGYNASGQLGYGRADNLGDNEPISGLQNISLTGTVRKVVAGLSHTCALTDAGTLRCWGNGTVGQLGQPFNGGFGQNWGDSVNELPSGLAGDINTGAQITDVTSNGSHVCALSNDSRLKCWGYNGNGQLGTGDSSNHGAPPAMGVNLDGFSAYQISAGAEHSCALRSNNTVRCWGLGLDGRLGRGSVGSSSSASGDVDVQIFTP